MSWFKALSFRYVGEAILRLVKARLLYDKDVYKALLLAIHLHGPQKRKYTNSPYWFHLQNVCNILIQYQVTDKLVLIAALLHDTLEDVKGLSKEALSKHILNTFRLHEEERQLILQYIIDLTDVYTKEAYPTLNRKARKNLEVQRLTKVSERSKLIKLADICDNTRSIQRHDKEFYESCYKQETSSLAYICREAHEGIYKSILTQYEAGL